jgi:hypothetical protein
VGACAAQLASQFSIAARSLDAACSLEALRSAIILWPETGLSSRASRELGIRNLDLHSEFLADLPEFFFLFRMVKFADPLRLVEPQAVA